MIMTLVSPYILKTLKKIINSNCHNMLLKVIQPCILHFPSFDILNVFFFRVKVKELIASSRWNSACQYNVRFLQHVIMSIPLCYLTFFFYFEYYKFITHKKAVNQQLNQFNQQLLALIMTQQLRFFQCHQHSLIKCCK